MTSDEGRRATPAAAAADWWARNAAGDLTEADRQLFALWLKDPANARAYAQMDQVFAMTQSGDVARAFKAERSARSNRKAGLVLALAASLAAATLGAGVWTGWLGPQTREQAPSEDHASAVGEIRTLRLGDGSIVRLDTNSRVRVAFSAAERRITLLSGRARFEVAHDAKRPFIVRADGQAIIAVGTVFDVRLDGNHVAVALIEGKVRVVEGRPDEAPRRVTELRAGQRFAADDGALPVIARLKAAEAWPDRILNFENATLRSVVDEANRYSNTKIIIGDPALAERRLTINLTLGEADAVARRLATGLGLEVARDANGDVVISDIPDAANP